MTQAFQKSSDKTQRLHPAGLAKALDLWALRREKLLPLLDVRAAREARRLAQGCRRLAGSERSGEMPASVWESEWLSIREQAVMLLDGGQSQRTVPASGVPASGAPASGGVVSSGVASSKPISSTPPISEPGTTMPTSRVRRTDALAWAAGEGGDDRRD